MPPSTLRMHLKPLAGLLLGVCLFGPLGAAQASPQGSAMADAQSAARLASWQLLLESAKGEDDRALLERVNRFVNRSVSFVSDQQAWGQQDYWATPAQTLGRGMGDCEDFAIAKYFTLLALGVNIDRLKITYVKARDPNPINQSHMVLTYYLRPESVPLVLDNLVADIKPATERPDLTPVYAFNGDGLWLAKERNLGRVASGPGNISLWRDLNARIGKEFD